MLRPTLITKLAESGAGDETIMAIAGHASRAMLSRYAHIRTEAKPGVRGGSYQDCISSRAHKKPPLKLRSSNIFQTQWARKWAHWK
ncbi:MAG: hypothetical protein ACRD1R_02755 [Acidobacteriota bacterium]